MSAKFDYEGWAILELFGIMAYPAHEKQRAENRQAAAVEAEKYQRENPYGCVVKHCGKRFRTPLGLKQHCRKVVARADDDESWKTAHAKLLESTAAA